VWIHDAEEGTASLQSDLFMAVWRLFKANNISIPYPQREVRILGAAVADIKDDNKDG
jgi:small-conductance mechanosensitive channel